MGSHEAATIDLSGEGPAARATQPRRAGDLGKRVAVVEQVLDEELEPFEGQRARPAPRAQGRDDRVVRA